MNTQKIRNTVILILLLLTPILNIGEVLSLMKGDSAKAYWFTTPLYIKLIKDIGFLIIGILSIPIFWKTDKKMRNAVMLFLAVLSAYTALLFFISYRNNPIQALLGLRWIAPVFLTALMAGTIDEDIMAGMAKVITVVFLLSVCVQFYEFLKFYPPRLSVINGQTLAKYFLSAPWVGGIYILYNTAGFFACVSMFLIYFYMNRSALRLLALILVPISIYFARSGTGIPTYLLSNFLIWIRGRFTVITLLLLVAASFLILSPTTLLRRSDVTKYIKPRVVDRLAQGIKETGMISGRFGQGANSVVLYNQKVHSETKGLILDSTLAAIVYNTGRLGLIAAVILSIVWLIFVLLSGRPDAIVFTFIYGLFALTASVMEAFPMNLIFAVGAAYFVPKIFSWKRIGSLMAKFDVKNAIGSVVICLIFLTPIFNIGEVWSVLTTEKKFFHMLTIQTPLYVKIIKDIGFLAIIILSIFGLKKLEKDKLKLFVLFFTPLALLTVISFVMACRTSLLQAMAGLRWMIPIFLAVFMIGNVDDGLMRKMAKAIMIVFFISFFIQIYESFMIKGAVHFSGDILAFLKSWWSYNTMASGIFIMYNTAGLFACETLFLVYFYLKRSRLRLVTLCLIPVNLLLASSGTGFPTYILANYLIWIKGKIDKTTIAVFILIAALLVYLLPIVISRPGISGNLTGRARLCFQSFREAGLFSSNFGKGTNAMVLFSQKFGTPNTGQVLDSTVTGIVVNTGRIGLGMALFSYIAWLVLVLRSRRLDALVFTLIYTLFSLTVPITEAFPMSLILAVGLGYFTPIILSKDKKNKAALKMQ